MNRSGFIQSVLACLLFVGTFAEPVGAAARQTVSSRFPTPASRLRREAGLAPEKSLHLALALPLQNRAELNTLVAQVSDPRSPKYRQYLTPEQFTARFGPSEADYSRLIAYARAQGFQVSGTHPNRTLLEIEGAAATIENSFHLSLGVYRHPTEPRTFYAADTEPRLDLDLPLLEIDGLNDYSHAHPRVRRAPTPGPTDAGMARAGSGPNGTFLGTDFRQAYIPGSPLTGSAQSVGLFELDGYFASDITAYLALSKQRAVPLKNVLVSGFNGVPSSRQSGSGNEEVALDIEMAMSMAPGLDSILVYEADPKATVAQVNSLLNRMATDNLAKQLSCSWGFDITDVSQQIFQQYAAQGQSFFLASGDNGAFNGPVEQPSDDPYIITVGGTILKTTSTRAWKSETVWSGSGGGISTIYPIPWWQQGLNFAVNQGSPTRRNVPDVALVALDVWATADRGRAFTLQGTSIAAPLWAGFTALINQAASAQGAPPVGFLNPALYQLARTPRYAEVFHDPVSGNNFTTDSPALFSAVEGYDLCTGLGSPLGTNLIQALLSLPPPDSLILSLPSQTTFLGPMGGPFTSTNQTFTLRRSNTQSIPWAISAPPPWLDVSATAGTLSGDGSPSEIVVYLNQQAYELLIGVHTGTLWFTNLSSGQVQGRTLSIEVGNPGFEAGDLTYWEFDGDPLAEFADSIDSTFLFGNPTLPGVDDSAFVHTGIWGAYIGEPDKLGFLRQTVPTLAGQRYQISFWLTNPTNGTPNEFHARWGDQPLLDQSDLDALPWTRYQYTAVASGSTTVLEFSFRHQPAAFGLDDVRVQALPVPNLVTRVARDGTPYFMWTTVPGFSYQIQFKNSLSDPDWLPLGTVLSASQSALGTQDPSGPAGQRFYRVITSP